MLMYLAEPRRVFIDEIFPQVDVQIRTNSGQHTGFTLYPDERGSYYYNPAATATDFT
jgi:hypothetical protein